jgi:hypothetical protein
VGGTVTRVHVRSCKVCLCVTRTHICEVLRGVTIHACVRSCTVCLCMCYKDCRCEVLHGVFVHVLQGL